MHQFLICNQNGDEEKMKQPETKKETGEYLNGLDLLDKISDITRIVDPVKKRVIRYHNSEIDVEEIRCFDFWGKNKVCDNCISMRAYHENATYFKIEYNKDKIYMITAVPHSLDGRRIVIEILKDITNSYVLDFKNDAVVDQTIHMLIDNMNKLAFSDSLTGLYNRRYIAEKLPVDLLNTALSSTHLSLIMADIDHFKKVNDDYGHVAGDDTLQNVAKLFFGCLKRESDWISRYGGEEFLICMPGADLEAAKKAAQRMRQALEDAVTVFEEKEIRVTASFGIYSPESTINESVEELLKHADEKLYQAKRNGRNRVEY